MLKGTGSKTDTAGNMLQAKKEYYIAWADPKMDDLYYWWSITDGTGGSQPHNNMPPYLAVYMFRRTA